LVCQEDLRKNDEGKQMKNMNVGSNYRKVLTNISEIANHCGRNPREINLVTVSKTHSLESILPIYESGCRDFGENKLQDVLPKKEEGPSDIKWHFIGTLQKNKVRKAIGKFALIHSVDSVELARKISDISVEKGFNTRVLLQANTSGEESKHGLTAKQWKDAWEELLFLPGLTIQGLMTMAPLVDDEIIIRTCFSKLRILRDDLVKLTGNKIMLPHLSMGMSHDYPIAIEEGATLLRIGSAIFGE
jgi:PLP dependent protein